MLMELPRSMEGALCGILQLGSCVDLTKYLLECLVRYIISSSDKLDPAGNLNPQLYIQTLTRVCKPITNKPKPAPPKLATLETSSAPPPAQEGEQPFVCIINHPTFPNI